MAGMFNNAVTAITAVVVGAVLAGALSDGVSAQATDQYRDQPKLRPIVAVGDSFLAGIGAGDYDEVNGCRRSRNSMPALLAQRNGAALVDLTCPGATTAHTDRSMAAIPQNSGLILIQVGGNDIGFLTIAGACFIASERACLEQVSRGQSQVPSIATDLRHQIATIKQRSRDADIVVLGYPRLLGNPRQCESLMTPARVASINALQRQLDRTLRAVAISSGARFVDWPRRIDRHSLCSTRPWYALPGTRIDDLLHPTPIAARVMARHVGKALSR